MSGRKIEAGLGALHERYDSVSRPLVWGISESKEQPDIIHPQLSHFLSRVTNDDPRIMGIGSDRAWSLAQSIIGFDRDVVRRGGKLAVDSNLLKKSRRVVDSYVSGIPKEKTAYFVGVDEGEVDILLTSFFERVKHTKHSKYPNTLSDYLDDYFKEEREEPVRQDLTRARVILVQPPAITATTREDIELQRTTELEASRQSEIVKIAEVPSSWAEKRKGDYLTILDDDTLAHSDWPRGRLILTEHEIPIINMLMELQPGEWINTVDAHMQTFPHIDPSMILAERAQYISAARLLTTRRGKSTMRSLLGTEVDKDIFLSGRFGLPDPNSSFDSILVNLHDLGLVERHSTPKRFVGKVLNRAGINSNVPLMEWRLKPSFVIEDKRHELQTERHINQDQFEVGQAIGRVQENLLREGFAFVTDEELGFGPELTEEFTRIFNSGILEAVPGDRPPTRWRARDVLEFLHFNRDGITVFKDGRMQPTPDNGEEIILRESDSNDVVTHAKTDIKDRPKYNRVMVEEHPLVRELLVRLLMCIPPEERERYQLGTASVDFLRTFKIVVEKIHKDFGDDEDGYVAIRVNKKIGEGARTRLYGKIRDLIDKKENHDRPRFTREIPEGGILIFKDGQFSHDVTQLIVDATGHSERDASIFTIQYAKKMVGQAA
jgi:hypothetical protein